MRRDLKSIKEKSRYKIIDQYEPRGGEDCRSKTFVVFFFLLLLPNKVMRRCAASTHTHTRHVLTHRVRWSHTTGNGIYAVSSMYYQAICSLRRHAKSHRTVRRAVFMLYSRRHHRTTDPPWRHAQMWEPKTCGRSDYWWATTEWEFAWACARVAVDSTQPRPKLKIRCCP